MNKFFLLLLIGSIFSSSDYGYNGSTVAAVTFAGGIIKAKSVDTVKKYDRKSCPVCKGKGWYISGDGIKKVDCGYCEEPKEDATIHPPIIIKSNYIKDK